MAQYDEAKQLHEQGLAAELNGRFSEAHLRFAGALALLPHSCRDAATIGLRADAMRDDGFTHTREAIAASSPEDREQQFGAAYLRFEEAYATIRSALGKDALARESRLPPSEYHSTEEQTALRTNIGATAGLVARTHTVEAVFDWRDRRTHYDHGLHSAARKRYGEALHNLWHGNNGYYLVSNAMAAARHEIIFGSMARTIVWRGVALAALIRTKLFDPGNYAAAKSTYHERKRHYTDPRTAEMSVDRKP